jgi:3-deoxy-7-phosphoheptulonate synthase
VSAVYQLAARLPQKENTFIEISSPCGKTTIGEGFCTIIAGSCAVESREQYLELVQLLQPAGVHLLRGGIYKPRTSPYSFTGLGSEGLGILEEARKLSGLPVVSEVLDIRDLDRVCQVCDMVQIGSRNMQNFALLKEVGKFSKPVLLKRGLAATIEEWLGAAEYILMAGNQQVVLCERGIRTFEDMTRNTVDIGAVALVKELSHLPVIVDPSHATGRRSLVSPVARAAIAAGADGLMIEVHQNPDEALSDGKQSLTPEEFAPLAEQIKAMARFQGKSTDAVKYERAELSGEEHTI